MKERYRDGVKEVGKMGKREKVRENESEKNIT